MNNKDLPGGIAGEVKPSQPSQSMGLQSAHVAGFTPR